MNNQIHHDNILENLRSDSSTFIKNIAQILDVREPDIRIKYGASGRVVYGKIGKEFREELDEPKLATMVEAMQQPATANDKDKGKGKPVIEITVNEQTVFRQEKNGTVTVNQIQLQREITSSLDSPAPIAQETAQPSSPGESKKLKFPALQKEAEAVGLKLKRHKTSGYILYIAGTSDFAHEGSRLKKLSDVQASIQQYREKQNIAVETQAAQQSESVTVNEVPKAPESPEIEAAILDTPAEQVEVTAPTETEEVQISIQPENEKKQSQVEELVELETNIDVENTSANEEISVEQTAASLEQKTSPPSEAGEIQTAELDSTDTQQEIITNNFKQVEEQVVAYAPELDSDTSNTPTYQKTQLQSLLSEIEVEINLEPSNLPHPQTPEQIRSFLEVEAEFWKESGLEIGVEKGEIAANFADKLKDLAVSTDEKYRADVELANSEWNLAYQSDLEQNTTAGWQQIASEAANNNLSNVLENLKLPFAFVAAAKEIQALPADNVRALLNDWVSTASKDVFEKVNEGAAQAKAFGELLADQFKNLQSKAVEFTEKAESLHQKTASQVDAIKARQADQNVAQTALRVYKHHHERMFKDADYRQQHQGEFNTFKGQKYTITQKGKNFYELSSTETKQILMQFKETVWRLEVKQNPKNMQPQDYREFSQIKEKLNRLGVGEVQGIGQKHYGGMQPQSSTSKRDRGGMALT